MRRKPVPDNKQKEQLRRAKAVVADRFPGMEVIALFFDPRIGFEKIRVQLLSPIEETMNQADLSDALTDLLGLEQPLIAITFHDVLPDDGVPRFDEPMSDPTEDGRSGRAAAPCVFWMHAHERTFDTVAEDHGNCSVGRFIHGFAEAADILDKDDVADLLEVGWGDGGLLGCARFPAAPQASNTARWPKPTTYPTWCCSVSPPGR